MVKNNLKQNRLLFFIYREEGQSKGMIVVVGFPVFRLLFVLLKTKLYTWHNILRCLQLSHRGNTNL